MRCVEAQPLLLPFHLGACEEPTRDLLERHLEECKGCLERFFSTKRGCESASAFEERPSPMIREKVHALAVAQGMRPRSKRARLTLVVGLAAAAVLLWFISTKWLNAPPQLRAPQAEQGLVDSSPPALDVF
jgi:hypothetical protein